MRMNYVLLWREKTKREKDASEVKETEMEEEKHKLCEETDKQSQTSVKRDGNSEETHSPETHTYILDISLELFSVTCRLCVNVDFNIY